MEHEARERELDKQKLLVCSICFASSHALPWHSQQEIQARQEETHRVEAALSEIEQQKDVVVRFVLVNEFVTKFLFSEREVLKQTHVGKLDEIKVNEAKLRVCTQFEAYIYSFE